MSTKDGELHIGLRGHQHVTLLGAAPIHLCPSVVRLGLDETEKLIGQTISENPGVALKELLPTHFIP